MQSFHQHHGPAPVAILGANEEALDARAEGTRLRVWHGEHDDADELVALGLGPRVRLVEQYDDGPRAGLGLGDPVLPPGQELLVAERGHEEARHLVVRDALGLEAGEPWGQVGVRGGVEEVGLRAAVHHHGGQLLLLWDAVRLRTGRRNYSNRPWGMVLKGGLCPRSELMRSRPGKKRGLDLPLVDLCVMLSAPRTLSQCQRHILGSKVTCILNAML